MAKQTQVISRFDGGINTHFNKRDIPDNTLVKAENIMVDRHGKIRLMGTSEDSDYGTIAGTTYPGYGLFPFQSDYDNPASSTNMFELYGDFDIDSPREDWRNTEASCRFNEVEEYGSLYKKL